MERDYNKDWNEFWKEIVCEKDGALNLEQVKKELSDYSMILEEVPKVYCAVTGDTLSKPNYKAETVIRVFEDTQNEKYREWFSDEVEISVNNIASTLLAHDSSDYRNCLYEVLANLLNKNVEDLNDDLLQKLKNS